MSQNGNQSILYILVLQKYIDLSHMYEIDLHL